MRVECMISDSYYANILNYNFTLLKSNTLKLFHDCIKNQIASQQTYMNSRVFLHGEVP